MEPWRFVDDKFLYVNAKESPEAAPTLTRRILHRKGRCARRGDAW